MQFSDQSETYQINVLQQAWKRLKTAEWQIIHELADVSGLPFEKIESLLYQNPKATNFATAVRIAGCQAMDLFEEVDADLSKQVIMLFEKGFAWSEIESDVMSVMDHCPH